MRHFGNPAVAAVAAVVVDREDHQKVFSAGFGYRGEGTAWRLGQRIEPTEIATCQQDFCGPDTLAAFYRKSAIEAIGGFSTGLGDGLAGIDLALALREAEYRCVLEPQCLACAGDTAVRTTSAFRRGRYAERLFWRWASSHGWFASLLGHVAMLAGHCVVGLWRPTTYLELAGRAWSLLPAMFADRRPTVAQPIADEKPSVVAAPHFDLAHCRDKRQSSRVA